MNKNIGFGPIPWWFWNDRLEQRETLRQLHEIAQKGLSGVVLHARFGFDPDQYLSKKWFALVRLVLKEAKKLGVKIWIYDEYNWPSGSAAGKVYKENPAFGEHYLIFIRKEVNGPAELWEYLPPGFPVAVLMTDRRGGNLQDVSKNIQGDWISLSIPEGRWGINYFLMRPCGPVMPYTLGGYLIDHTNADATKAFLRYTHREYAVRYKSEFGKNILGFFTDEPGLYQSYGNVDQQTLPWSADFSAEFLHRKGYRIESHLLALWQDVGNDSWVHRCNYYDVISQLFQKNYWDLMQKWCQKNNLLLVGHPNGSVRGDVLQSGITYSGHNMRMLGRMSIPGMDRINRDSTFLTEKITSSVAHLTGKSRASSETFGCFNWQLTLQEMKEWTDRQFVRGINMLFLHAFYYSIEGFRREESPPSLFFHNLFWPYFKKYVNYAKRLASELSQGIHIAPIAVYYPIISAFGASRAGDCQDVDSINSNFKNLCAFLSEHQWDFDIIDDQMIYEAKIAKGCLQVGKERFFVLILPHSSILPEDTIKKITAFLEAGGRVIATGTMPERVLSVGFDENKIILSNFKKYFSSFSGSEKPAGGKIRGVNVGKARGSILWVLDHLLEKDFYLESHNPGIKFMHKRLTNGDIYFVVNESSRYVDNLVILQTNHRPALVDCDSGLIFNPRDGKQIGEDHWQVRISIAPGGSQLLLCNDQGRKDYKPGGDVPELTTVFSLADLWNLSIERKRYKTMLRPWGELGHPYFSGTAVYETNFRIDSFKKGRRYFVDLGEVKEIAKLELNSKLIGVAAWRPFLLEVTNEIKVGINHLRIEVTNTLANTFYRQDRPSGLLGPVKFKIDNST